MFGGKSLFDVFNQKPQPHQTQPKENAAKTQKEAPNHDELEPALGKKVKLNPTKYHFNLERLTNNHFRDGQEHVDDKMVEEKKIESTDMQPEVHVDRDESKVIDEENNEDNQIEDNKLAVKKASHKYEEFEITHFREDVGCVHEVFAPKGHKQQGIIAYLVFMFLTLSFQSQNRDQARKNLPFQIGSFPEYCCRVSRAKRIRASCCAYLCR